MAVLFFFWNSCIIYSNSVSLVSCCVAYMLILENDSNAEVRRAVLSCIAMSPHTLPKVIKRTRDIKENVRKLAYQVAANTSKIAVLVHADIKICTLFFPFEVLADKVHIKALTIAQRVSLLQQGLCDPSGKRLLFSRLYTLSKALTADA